MPFTEFNIYFTYYFLLKINLFRKYLKMYNKEKLTSLKKELDNLPKKDTNLIIADFDDTIFSRKTQFENFPILIENRWNKWNEVIKDIIWINNFMETCFIGKPYPKTITSQLRLNHDLILTAWFEDIQKAKLKSTQLDKFNHIVVYDSKEKPFELINYVVKELKFIPNEIIIYEDRPNHFIEAKKIIEDFLWTKLKIMFVEMESNDKEAKITEIFS